MKNLNLIICGLILFAAVCPARAQQRSTIPVKSFEGHSSPVKSVAFNSDGTKLFSGGLGSTIKIWDVETGIVVGEIGSPSDQVTDFGLSSSDRYLVSALQSGEVVVWDIQQKKQIARVKAHTAKIRTLAISPSGRAFATGSVDKTVKIWALPNTKYATTLRGHTGWVMDVAYSPSGNQLASVSSDKTVRIWNTRNNTLVGTLKGAESGLLSVAFSPDGKYLATGESGSSILIWDTSTWQILRRLNHNFGRVHSLVYPASSRYLASATSQGFTIVWETTTGAQVQLISGHTSTVNALAYTPDGKYLATASNDQQIKLWFSYGPLIDLLNQKTELISINKSIREKEKERLLAPRGEFETIGAYQKRISLGSRQAAAIDSMADLMLSSTLRPITRKINDILYETLGPIEVNEITIGKYNPDNQHFAITVLETDFTVAVPLSKAPAIKESVHTLSVVGERQLKDVGSWQYMNLVLIDPANNARYPFGPQIIPYMPIEKLIERRNILISSIESKVVQRTAHLFSPRGEFETKANYKQRKASAEQQRAAADSTLRSEIATKLIALEEQINRSLLDTREPRVFSAITLGRYNPDDKTYPVTLESKTFQIMVPLVSAPEVKENSTELRIEGTSQLTLEGSRRLFNLVLIDPLANKRYTFGDQLAEMPVGTSFAQASEQSAFFTVKKFSFPQNLTVETTIGGI